MPVITRCLALSIAVTVTPVAPSSAQSPESLLAFPSGLALEPGGDAVLVADRRTNYILRVDLSTGVTTVVAGTGVGGFTGDGGPATEAQLRHPEWLAFDSRGNLVIADRGNHRLRRLDATTGTISTIAGTGVNQRSGDGGPAAMASLTNPFGVLLDDDDNILVFDTESHTVRRIDATSGVITTVVGTGEQGFSGDGGPGNRATMYRPHNGVFDPRGRLVFGDSFNQRIRRWDPGTGLIETIAGNGAEGPPEVGAAAVESPFRYFGGLAIEPDGSIVVTSLDQRIVRLDHETGLIELIAGTGDEGFGGDGGPAIAATLRTPYGIVLTPAGDLIVADAGNGRIRKIDGRTGIITTVAVGR